MWSNISSPSEFNYSMIWFGPRNMKGSLASWCVTGSMQWFIRAFLLLLKTGDQTTEDVYDKTKMVVLHLRATKKTNKKHKHFLSTWWVTSHRFIWWVTLGCQISFNHLGSLLSITVYGELWLIRSFYEKRNGENHWAARISHPEKLLINKRLERSSEPDSSVHSRV